MEGLVSGQSLGLRYDMLAGMIPLGDIVWKYTAEYIVQAVVNVTLTFSLQCVILGGGVMKQEHLFPMIRQNVTALLADYIQSPYLKNIDSCITSSGCADNQCIMGTYLLGKKHWGEKMMIRMGFNTGLNIYAETDSMTFIYGRDVCGPKPEVRHLSDIRESLSDMGCTGPENIYGIAMDVYHKKDRKDLMKRNLLFGVVAYAAGQLGDEPIRSQGHIHAISPSCNSSTCEVYEIWSGKAIIYMQESGSDDAGNCYGVYAKPGDVVIVPPGWVHATINMDVNNPMVFGAWCIRDYGYDYKAVREHHGIAFFPKIKENTIIWEANPAYKKGCFLKKEAREYLEFHIQNGVPIYEQYQGNPSLFDFVANPKAVQNLWDAFVF